ncbi:hypothetical protein CTEN210_13416 [Chaetoceros tenuissimus]|uniref:KAP NTPase domain-containing protein n=1 Tax=Chaetoceros tenuissimus TaxID=426638 RepID=A0AAD3D559_9STRA|nr:hypothetical protein CTEN210_13416 [Chaetoceros tenuissimus]
MRLLRKLTNKEWKEISEKYKDGGVHMYKGKKTLFYNGEKLLKGVYHNRNFLVYNNKERKAWEVIIVLPGVEVIPTYTFFGCKNVKTVFMADSVKRIEKSAFWVCSKLAFVKLSRDLEYIGDSAFWCCKSLTSIFIPPSCREIDNWAFAHCKKLIIIHASQHTQLGEYIIADTALIKKSPIEVDEKGDYNKNNLRVNAWIKSRHDEFPLHTICSSEDPTLSQEFTANDWAQEDDCNLTPLHCLFFNPMISLEEKLKAIQKHRSILVGDDQENLGSSILFDIASSPYLPKDIFDELLDKFRDLISCTNSEGRSLLDVCSKFGDGYGNTIRQKNRMKVCFNSQITGLNDDPKKTPDRLGYQVFADGITYVVQQAEKSDAYFCVGLFGPWGCGKSKLWTLIKEKLQLSEVQQNKGSSTERIFEKQKTKYIFAEFNAWTYNGTDNLWASFMENIWSAIESEFTSNEIRLHRASIALSNEDENDDWDTKQKKRKKALQEFYIWSIISFILAVAGTSIGIWLLVSKAIFDFKNNRSHKWIGGIISLTISPIPFWNKVFIFKRDVLPYLRRNSKEIFQAALLGGQHSRRDFSQDMGYMGEIKKEAEYLFDYLRERNSPSRRVRMCLFVDDLDRCNSQTVVSVLEAVFLLLSESPITCYLAIDTRLVVASIDEHYTVHDRAGINGYDFLEKIVQLPFCIPDLSDSKKVKFMEHLFLSAYLQPTKICDAISLLQQEGTYLQAEILDAPPTHMNSEKEAFQYLVEQFVTNLEKKKFFMTDTQKVYFTNCGASILLDSDGSKKESFLFMVASFLQHIQELERSISGEIVSLQPTKICDTISLLQQEGTYLQAETLEAPPDSMNSERAFQYLVEQFVTNLEKSKVFMTETQKVYFANCDVTALLGSDGSKKESFLVNIASYLQQIQEIKTTPVLLGEIPSVTEELVKSPVVKEITTPEPESKQDVQEEEIDEDDIDVFEDVEEVGPNDDNTSELSKDMINIAPFASMVTPKERKWFKDFAPFVVGKARSITRVVNIYNLARYVAEHLLQNYTNDDSFKRKMIKVILLAEFWPYRTAFLMQVAEDLVQIQQIRSIHSKEDDIHLDEDHGSLYDALCLLFDQFANYSHDEMIDHIMEMSLSTLYNKIVQRLLCSPKNQTDTKKMLSRDCDPQMFVRLLSDVCTEGKLKDRLKVKDFVVPSNLEHSSSCLRFLTLNMSRHMLEFTSKCLNDLVVFVDSQGLGSSVKTLRFDYKSNHYQSEAVGLIESHSNRRNGNSILIEVKNEQGITCHIYELSTKKEKIQTIGSIFSGSTEIENIVKVNGNAMKWRAIENLQFSKLQRMCGETKEHYIFQFLSDPLISNGFQKIVHTFESQTDQLYGDS